MFVTGTGNQDTNSRPVTGGPGGAEGTSSTTTYPGGRLNGARGAGGVGVIGRDTVCATTSGTIGGGMGGAEAQADAVDLPGGGNTPDLLAGSTLTGNVVSASGTANGIGMQNNRAYSAWAIE